MARRRSGGPLLFGDHFITLRSNHRVSGTEAFMVRGVGRAGRTRETLQQQLAKTPSMTEAAKRAADHLVAAGISMPSVYLEQSGRLRCVAARGFWQVIDGIPPGVGVVGRCFAERRPVEVHDVGSASGVLSTIPGVTSELCVPIAIDDVVVGVVNAEFGHPLPETAEELLTRAAAALAERARVLGLPAESPYQRLAWYTTRLAELTSEEDIEQLALAAASELADMGTALIARRSMHGFSVSRARGILAEPLRVLEQDHLETIASWVEVGMSCWTRGDQRVIGIPTHQALRTAGVSAFVTLPLIARAQRIGFLLTASTRPLRPAAETLGRLELLASQTASVLQTTRAITELRERASRDALTGLGHHASFHTLLDSDRHAARNVAVLLIDIDRFKDINDSHGHLTGDAVLVEMADTLSDGLRDGDRLYRIGGDEFASILDVRSPAEAVDVAERLRQAAESTGWSTVSIGVAWGPAGKDLVARADHALYEAKHRGRNSVCLAAAEG
jgi:diguanylate cyclase (GGDEF)-like protein